MDDIINIRPSYYDMFKWHNYYSYYDSLAFPETSGVCELCALLNNKLRREERKTYRNIVKWFNDRKDWNFGADKQPFGKIVTMHGKNVTNKNRTLINKLQDELNLNSTTNKIGKVVTPYKVRKSQEDYDFVVYNNVLVTIRDNYKIDNENDLYKFMFDTGKDKYKIMNENNDNKISLGKKRRKKHRRHKIKNKRVSKIQTEDTSIRCPNFRTCLDTIISNMKRKIMSLFS